MKGFRVTVFLKNNANVESFTQEPMHGFLRRSLDLFWQCKEQTSQGSAAPVLKISHPCEYCTVVSLQAICSTIVLSVMSS